MATNTGKGETTARNTDDRQRIQRSIEAIKDFVERFLLVILVSFLIPTALLGVVLHKSAKSPALPESPQSVQVYANHRDVAITLTADVTHTNYNYECLYLTTATSTRVPNTKIIVTASPSTEQVSTQVPTDCTDSTKGDGLDQVRISDPALQGTGAFVTDTDAIRKSQRSDPNGLLVGEFLLGDDAVTISNDAYEAHLPWLGALEYPSNIPDYLSEIDEKTSAIKDLIEDPVPVQRTGFAPLNPDDPHSYAATNPGDLYFVPENLSTVAKLENAELDFIQTNEYHIDQIIPQSGDFQGRDLVWRGDLSLDASIAATTPGEEVRIANDDFYSGIFIATAAAIAIALLQELANRSKRKRGNTSSQLAGQAPAPEAIGQSASPKPPGQ